MRRAKSVKGCYYSVLGSAVFSLCLPVLPGPDRADDRLLQEQIKALKRGVTSRSTPLSSRSKASRRRKKTQPAKAQAAPPVAAAPQAPKRAGHRQDYVRQHRRQGDPRRIHRDDGYLSRPLHGVGLELKVEHRPGGLPLPNSPNYYMDEVRGSARGRASPFSPRDRRTMRRSRPILR